ncbi:flagellar biosynthetic protein FliR [Rickettsiaceae bacterium]|nr:flagellar biosynthetic protein FliR [Rickettsiaceae bacterium]
MLGQITLEFIFQFMLVFARLGTAFRKFPAIGSPYFFSRGKLALAITISFVMMPILTPYLPKYTDSFVMLVGYLAIEILIGLIISLAANIYFLSLHFVGQIVSMQSGLGAAAFFDPVQKSQVTLFSNFMLLVAIVFIFATDTHHLFVQAVADSYQKFPPGELLDSGDISKFVAFVINDSFILSFKIVSPFLVVALAVMTGSGMLARLMPNLQVFFVITPAQIIIMFGTMYIVIQAAVTKLTATIANSLNVIGY